MAASGEKPGGTPALSDDGEMSAAGKPRYKGRLELTWTNKGEALLSHEDGSYEWVPKRDHRVAEVRLLRDAGNVGEVHPEISRARDNLLIRGDALHALTALNSLPEFADEYAGKVKLVYIDPPFNTGQAFAQYDDGLEHSVWLTMMRDRLVQVKELLAPDGSVWVHLDDAEMAYCRVMMDDVFGRENFVAAVVWEKSDSPRMDAHNFSVRHDTILVYGASSDFRVNQFMDETPPAHYNKRTSSDEPYYLKPLRAMGGQGSTRAARPTLYFPLTAPDGTAVLPKLPDGGDGCWRWSPGKLEKDRHLIEWINTDAGWSPYYRIFWKPTNGRPPETLWPHTEVGSNRTSKAEIKALFPDIAAFDTPKPERLIERVIFLGSDPGDIVLDCFAGSGTTAAVAHKMGRRWVTSELSRETLDTFTAPRLEKVINGQDAGGITAAAEWNGGGGFRVLDLAPSMYEDDAGIVVLADWAENAKLAEVVSAQLGFTYAPDTPFCGQRGRMRLAVIDGHVDESAVRLLVNALPEGQRLSLAATSLAPEAPMLLTKLRSGSRVRAVPQDILLSYRTPSAWRASVAMPADAARATTGNGPDVASETAARAKEATA